MPIRYDAELVRLETIITDAELRITRQRELIERMKMSDLPAEDACKTLDVMLGVLETLLSYRSALLRFSKAHLH
jgi:DNA-directed RNA polymerase specialized sigma24 family protein